MLKEGDLVTENERLIRSFFVVFSSNLTYEKKQLITEINIIKSHLIRDII